MLRLARIIQILFAVLALLTVAHSFSLSPGKFHLRGSQNKLSSKAGILCMSGQPDTGRGSDADVAAAYFREQEERKKKAEEEAAKPKKTLDFVDEGLEKWKAEKQAQKAEQDAAIEAKMAAWMKAAEEKKKAAGG